MGTDASDDAASSSSERAGSEGVDEVVLYGVVRKAVEDAILSVIGTLLLLGVAFVLVLVGFSTAARLETAMGVGLGAVAVLLGAYLAASTLELIPPIREWL